ncbi:MAG TPA: serine hydrolase domain-containing protein [Solirubrobacteraceae bacterium]|nr:serine hydrolase domain-containing protein [Solirubrobacteraceae bacterium]
MLLVSLPMASTHRLVSPRGSVFWLLGVGVAEILGFVCFIIGARPTLGTVFRFLTAGVAAAVAFTGSVPATQARPLPSANRQYVDQSAQRFMQTERLPGVSLVISGPKGSYVKSYGVANLATRAPFRPTDHVRIASITKSFTATAVLEQVQRGRLSLSDKLSRWVRGIPNGNRITVRQLLAMRSGIYDYTSDPAWNRRFNTNPLSPFTPSDALSIIRHHRPAFAPGAKTEYADSNYVLLGIILQKVTGRSVESVITKDVIKPAGLRFTSFPTTSAIPRPFAHGYYAGEDGKGPMRDYTRINPRLAWTAGGMISTVGDVAKWGRILARGSLLSRRLQHQRLHFGMMPAANRIPFGYGLGIIRLGDWLGHDGAIYGFSSVTFYDRVNGAEITAVANQSSNFTTPTLDIFGQIAKRLYPGSLRPQ